MVKLKRYPEAESAFNCALDMAPNCEEMQKELHNLRCEALVEIGCSEHVAGCLALDSRSIEEAIERFLDGKPYCKNFASVPRSGLSEKPKFDITTRCRTLSLSDKPDKHEYKVSMPKTAPVGTGDDSSLPMANGKWLLNLGGELEKMCQTIPKTIDTSPYKPKPTNLLQLKGLCVSNVGEECDEETLVRIFSKFGEINRIDRNFTAHMVHIDYVNTNSPAEAIRELHAVPQKIYGDKGHEPFGLKFAISADQQGEGKYSDIDRTKLFHIYSGNAECFYWRLKRQGCSYTSNCPYGCHIPINKAIDSTVEPLLKFS